jgi:hypothetical protein
MIRATAGQSIGAQMVNATTGAAFSGAVTVYVTIDAGTQAIGSVGSGLCTSEGNGYFTYAPAAAETDGALIAFTFIGSGAVPATIQVATVTESQQAALGAGSTTAAAFTGLGLINAALKTIGVLAAGETASPEDAADALLRLNEMIDAWGTQRLTIYELKRTTKTLTASTASYTIGTGGSINIVRPVWIESAGLIIDTAATIPVEIPIRVLTDDEWSGIVLKTLTSPLAQGIYYDHGWVSGLATISVYPIPTVSTTQLVLYCPTAVLGMALATSYAFPPGYAKLLRYGLANELMEFGVPNDVQDRVAVKYAEAMADVKRANHRTMEMSLPAGLGGQRGVYDIFSDSNGGRP